MHPPAFLRVSWPALPRYRLRGRCAPLYTQSNLKSGPKDRVRGVAGIRRRGVKGTRKSKAAKRSASIGGTSQTSFAGASMSNFEPPPAEGERAKAKDLANLPEDTGDQEDA